MSKLLVKKLHDQGVEIDAAAQSHAAPSDSGDGIDLTGGDIGSFREDVWEVYLDLVSGSPIVVSGAYIAIYDEDRDKWTKVVDLNGGADITITTGVGFSERVVDIGTGSRLAVVNTGDSGTHVYGAIPILHR